MLHLVPVAECGDRHSQLNHFAVTKDILAVTVDVKCISQLQHRAAVRSADSTVQSLGPSLGGATYCMCDHGVRPSPLVCTVEVTITLLPSEAVLKAE